MKENKTKYFLYARKSSESEDRQTQSIDDQIHRLKQIAIDLNLDIIEVYTEAKSAKKPNNRPIFDEMMDRIKKGDADGLLCWQINRLSRNPIDSGTISWYLQNSILKSIQTIDKEYLPDDNVLLLSVESSSANQFILDLSKNVKRGIQSKLEKGWKPGLAPTGYLNDLNTHTITKDSVRFLLIRKAWDYMLTGNYTVPQILEKLNNEWGFLSLKKKRSGNKPLAMSGLYGIFTNLFYTGIIVHKNIQYPGKHEAMISMEEYDKVQIILGRKGKPRSKHHNFAFTGAIKCNVCGCFYTAENKHKLIKSTGEIAKYTYYRCTRKKKDITCNQKGCITKNNLELQIEKEIEKYTIIPDFLHWALNNLKENNSNKVQKKLKINENQKKTISELEKQLEELTRMRYRKLINDDFFIKEKEILQNKIFTLKKKLKENINKEDKYLDLTEKTFNFATYARNAFITAKGEEGLELKKEILMSLGETPLIQDKKLIIKPYEWLIPIKNKYPELEEEYLKLELNKKPLNKVKTEHLNSVITRWHGRKESNHRRRFWRPQYYHYTTPANI